MTSWRAAAVLVIAGACGIPGLRPEGRQLGENRYYAEADAAAVYDRSVSWLTRQDFELATASRPERIRAERAIQGGRINVITIRYVEETPTRTAYYVTGWTDVVAAGGRRQASQYDVTLSQVVSGMHEFLSCPIARWPACP